jgi:hypothetical protein
MLAKSLHIKGYSTMAMDKLCTAIRAQQSPQSLITYAPASAPTASPSALCLLDPNRPCGKNTSKKKNRYTLPELKALWKNECKDLPEFQGKKPVMIVDYCRLLKKRYMDIKFVAIKKLPQKTVDALKKWLHNFSRPVPQQDTLFLEVDAYDFVLKNSIGTLEVLEGKISQPLKRRHFAFHRGMTGTDFNMLKAKTDPHYLYNSNVANTFPKQWFQQQKDYIVGLPWMNKVRLLCYSYAGDKICNSFILGTFSAKNVVDTEFRTNYSRRIFPLALDMYLHTRQFSTFEKWIAFCGHGGNLTVETRWRDTYDHIKKLPFDEAYDPILMFFYLEVDSISEKMWYTWAGEYALHLNAIISDAPRVPSPGFYTYRGVNDASFVTANKNNVFLNETFMSTSLGIEVGLKFKDPKSACCLFTLQILPGSRCLFLGSLSYFPQEMEVLFAPGRQLFVTKNQFKASNPNKNLLVTRFSLMN